LKPAPRFWCNLETSAKIFFQPQSPLHKLISCRAGALAGKISRGRLFTMIFTAVSILEGAWGPGKFRSKQLYDMHRNGVFLYAIVAVAQNIPVGMRGLLMPL
jgi:hypothetical protein